MDIPALRAAIKPHLKTWAALRRDLHAHPELAFEERRTARMVARELRALGLDVHEGIGQTGVVGVLEGNAPGPAIALRADMDALPISEQNAFAHRSTVPGKMHACGHDGHTAILLGAAHMLARSRAFAGRIVFVFQPAEEGEGGARAMMADGLFERFPVQAIYGLHNWPGLPAGQMAVHEGPVMAAADRFDFELTGKGAHAAMPHLGQDPLVAGAALIQALQTLVSRNVSPVEPAVVSVTQFHAGQAYNVIPEQAQLCGTVRTFSKDVRRLIEQRMVEVGQGIARSFALDVRFSYQPGYPATVNTPAETAKALAAAKDVGWVRTDAPPSMGAEDFSCYLEEVPGCYVWLGNDRKPAEACHSGTLGEHGACSLHNPHYDFNDEIIEYGVLYWLRLVHHALKEG
jgi:amidohydrolase